MRAIRVASLCVVACVLAISGCYESLTNIATRDKLVFAADLIGHYKAAEPATGRLVLAKGKDDKSYAYQQLDDKGAVATKGTLWIIKLGNEHFYQLTVDGFTTADGRPVYGIGRLKVEGKPGARTLTGYAFKSQDEFFGDPLVTTAEYEHVERGEKRKSRAVSMQPEKLQEYLAAHAADMTLATLKYQQSGAGR